MSLGRATPAAAALPADRSAGRILVVTGHFPPAPGGVQTFTWEMLRRMPADRLVVVAPAHPDAAAFDAGLDFPVIRRRAYYLVRDLRRIVADYNITTCWIPAVAPIGLAAPFIRRAGVRRIVGSTHGQELGWLRVWATRRALRAMIGALDAVTYLSAYTRERLQQELDHPERMFQLVGGVDTEIFRPGHPDPQARKRLALPAGRTVISVARLVRRKGHDMVIRAWPRILEAVPDAQLVIPGTGVYRSELEKLAEQTGVRDRVHFTGYLPVEDLCAALNLSDAFVLACRDDRRGLQTEGLGLSTLEASATGLPVVVGLSGGSGDSVIDGVTGFLVDSSGPDQIASALITLLTDPARAKAMGARGAEWVQRTWTWDTAVDRLTRLLAGEPVGATYADELPVDLTVDETVAADAGAGAS
jgi:phosphatidylinositol alpha-1,6-mannosyltransferase